MSRHSSLGRERKELGKRKKSLTKPAIDDSSLVYNIISSAVTPINDTTDVPPPGSTVTKDSTRQWRKKRSSYFKSRKFVQYNPLDQPLSGVGKSSVHKNVDVSSAIWKAPTGHGREFVSVNDDYDLPKFRRVNKYGRLHYFHLKWFWDRESLSGRMRLFMMETFFILFLCYVIAVIVSFYTTDGEDLLKCDTEACRLSSQSILSRINPNIDPCHDFYGFVCGNVTTDFDQEYRIHLLQQMENFVLPINTQLSKVLGKFLTTLEKQAPYGKHMMAFYKACMDNNRREEVGTSIFRKVLKELRLNDMEGLQSMEVEEILSHWLRVTSTGLTGIWSPEHLLDFFTATFDLTTRRFVLYIPTATSIVYRYCSWDFDKTLEVVRGALRLLKTELDIKEEEEIRVIAADILCLEVELGYEGRILYDPAFVEHCRAHNETYRVAMNKLDPQGELNSPVNYTKLFRRLSADLSLPVNGTGYTFFKSTKTRRHFTHLNVDVFSRSSKQRIARYLQWALCRALYADMTKDIFNKILDVKPNLWNIWPDVCIDKLFLFFPDQTLDNYLNIYKNQEKLLQKESEMEKMIALYINTIFEKIQIPEEVTSCPEFKMKEAIIRGILSDVTWFEVITAHYSVRQKWLELNLHKLNQIQYETIGSKLAVSKDHMENVLSQSSWNATFLLRTVIAEKYSDLTSVSSQHRSNSILIWSYTDRAIYLPFALLEQMYFNNDIYAMDLAGYGQIVTTRRLINALGVIHFGTWKYLQEGFVGDKYKTLLGTFNDLKQDEKEKYFEEEIKKFATPQELREIDEGLYVYQAWQLSLELLLHVLKEHLKTNPPRIYLPGLPRKYSLEELFFIHFTRVNCLVYSPDEQTEIYWRIPTRLKVNTVLANTKHFANTWNCSKDARMRSSGGFNYIDWDEFNRGNSTYLKYYKI